MTEPNDSRFDAFREAADGGNLHPDLAKMRRRANEVLSDITEALDAGSRWSVISIASARRLRAFARCQKNPKSATYRDKFFRRL
jgi:hypothetical protein